MVAMSAPRGGGRSAGWTFTKPRTAKAKDVTRSQPRRRQRSSRYAGNSLITSALVPSGTSGAGAQADRIPQSHVSAIVGKGLGPDILTPASQTPPQWQLGLGLSGTRVPMDPGRTAVLQNPGEDGICHADGRQVSRHSLARGEVCDRQPQSVLAQENLS